MKQSLFEIQEEHENMENNCFGKITFLTQSFLQIKQPEVN